MELRLCGVEIGEGDVRVTGASVRRMEGTVGDPVLSHVHRPRGCVTHHARLPFAPIALYVSHCWFLGFSYRASAGTWAVSHLDAPGSRVMSSAA